MKFLSALTRYKENTALKTIAKTAAVLSLTTSLMVPGQSVANDTDLPLLVIGASYSNGKLPLNEDMNGVFGGLSIGMGGYLDLGQALIRDPRLSGHVVNEAVAGASTVTHRDCSIAGGTICQPALWISYDQQLDRALRRVNNLFVPGTYTAKYVVITTSNDCLHSNNYDVPEIETTPCTVDDMNAYIDRLIAVGQKALDSGLIPIFDEYPDSSDLDLAAAAQRFYWFIDDENFDFLGDLHKSRIEAELPGAVVLNIWSDFEHRGDGIHPTDKTSRKAAAVIAQYILDHQ